jgi:hypothetical protein
MLTRKRRESRRELRRQREIAEETEKWEHAVKAALWSTPGMVSEPMSVDYPRVVIRLP